ncbi:MAG: hypothetical protein GXO45_03220 [Aquificae bacterium]|nr:hypothetical protein [Aquificota bacterium]
MEEQLNINLPGVAVDVLSEEWQTEDVVQKTPVKLYKVSKRKGGFTLYMKTPYEDVEWYFSKGLTLFHRNGNTLRIEHEDGQYWVDLPAHPKLLEFLKEFIP